MKSDKGSVIQALKDIYAENVKTSAKVIPKILGDELLTSTIGEIPIIISRSISYLLKDFVEYSNGTPLSDPNMNMRLVCTVDTSDIDRHLKKDMLNIDDVKVNIYRDVRNRIKYIDMVNRVTIHIKEVNSNYITASPIYARFEGMGAICNSVNEIYRKETELVDVPERLKTLIAYRMYEYVHQNKLDYYGEVVKFDDGELTPTNNTIHIGTDVLPLLTDVDGHIYIEKRAEDDYICSKDTMKSYIKLWTFMDNIVYEMDMNNWNKRGKCITSNVDMFFQTIDFENRTFSKDNSYEAKLTNIYTGKSVLIKSYMSRAEKVKELKSLVFYESISEMMLFKYQRQK